MFRLRTLAALVFASSLVVGVGVAPADAGFDATVTTTVTKQSASVYLYTYVIANLATSTDTIGEFDLALTVNPFSGINTPAGAPISAITMPTGFGNTYTSGDPNIMFQSGDPSTDIMIGAMATFSFTSTYAPVLVPYQFDTFSGNDGPAMGMTFAPATVPEPSSLVLSGFGVLGLAGWLTRRRLAPSPAG